MTHSFLGYKIQISSGFLIQRIGRHQSKNIFNAAHNVIRHALNIQQPIRVRAVMPAHIRSIHMAVELREESLQIAALLPDHRVHNRSTEDQFQYHDVRILRSQFHFAGYDLTTNHPVANHRLDLSLGVGHCAAWTR